MTATEHFSESGNIFTRPSSLQQGGDDGHFTDLRRRCDSYITFILSESDYTKSCRPFLSWQAPGDTAEGEHHSPWSLKERFRVFSLTCCARMQPVSAHTWPWVTDVPFHHRRISKDIVFKKKASKSFILSKDDVYAYNQSISLKT